MLSRKCMRYLFNPRLLSTHCITNNINSPRLCNSNNKILQNESLSYFKTRSYASEATHQIDALKFEEVCENTLDSLCEYFEDLLENSSHLKGADVVYGDGVLTVSFGEPYGTYVINRQTPNKQIWLSSPVSGPKRYDFVMKDEGYWIYKHDGVTLHQLLHEEINKIVNNKADFSKCSHSLI